LFPGEFGYEYGREHEHEQPVIPSAARDPVAKPLSYLLRDPSVRAGLAFSLGMTEHCDLRILLCEKAYEDAPSVPYISTRESFAGRATLCGAASKGNIFPYHAFGLRFGLTLIIASRALLELPISTG